MVAGHPIRAHALDGVVNDFLVVFVDNAFEVEKIDIVCKKRLQVDEARRSKGSLLFSSVRGQRRRSDGTDGEVQPWKFVANKSQNNPRKNTQYGENNLRNLRHDAS